MQEQLQKLSNSSHINPTLATNTHQNSSNQQQKQKKNNKNKNDKTKQKNTVQLKLSTKAEKYLQQLKTKSNKIK